MSRSELKQAILSRCREVLATRERNKVCSICWFPEEWPCEDVWLALQEMRQAGIISCTRGSSTMEDGFLLNIR
ncbi:hypothetical protein [Pantoea anthophila]|uniref:Uncharacterized protein n=1 Tax=Pantoea anthophila TaxID=470931 RepID=A0ABY2Z5S1_9GAMM|nr:hypothetical protein [Pantoea anthophila]TPV23648.1 hypothetical protein FJW00_14935 [Pantoea anthophila]